jgi:hypothetical protein
VVEVHAAEALLIVDGHGHRLMDGGVVVGLTSESDAVIS